MHKDKPVYVMLSRRLVYTWVASTVVMFVLILASFQYTNYVDRRSNGYWCGIVLLFNSTNQKEPPKTDTGRVLFKEFSKMRKGFKCK